MSAFLLYGGVFGASTAAVEKLYGYFRQLLWLPRSDEWQVALFLTAFAKLVPSRCSGGGGELLRHRKLVYTPIVIMVFGRMHLTPRACSPNSGDILNFLFRV